jgi:hypothetical protein
MLLAYRPSFFVSSSPVQKQTKTKAEEPWDFVSLSVLAFCRVFN